VSRLDSLVRAHPFPSWHVAAWLVVLMLTMAILWANFARLDEVATAPAEVVPQGQVKVIQHLEGGILREISVRDGQKVKSGDPLVLLDLGASGLDRRQIMIQIDGLLLRRARLIAEAAGLKPEFPDDIAKRYPDLTESQRKSYLSRSRQLASALSVYKSQERQRRQEMSELIARRKSARDNLKLLRERYAMSTELVEKSLVSRMEHLALQSEVKALEGQLDQIVPAIPKLRAAIREVTERSRQAMLIFRRAAAEELGETELALARNRELLTRAADQVKRTLVKSPIDGVVKNLRFFTIGGVVGPGDPIMEIVPSGESLIIEGRLNPTDIGYVSVGQRATVKLSTYDYIRYGGLDGTVETVAADTSVDRSGNSFYKVVVRTEKSYLGNIEGSLPIIPGMQATVDIHTGEKSVIDYLITPVLKLKSEAFRER
jgi:membrane fusion protein, adhesin transport system